MHSFSSGTTAVNEWAASTVGGDQHTASPWGVTKEGLQTLGMQLGCSMKLQFREGLN